MRGFLDTTEVTPDGWLVVFMALRSLTGYDNRDAVSGVPGEKVYVYEAEGRRAWCVCRVIRWVCGLWGYGAGCGGDRR